MIEGLRVLLAVEADAEATALETAATRPGATPVRGGGAEALRHPPADEDRDVVEPAAPVADHEPVARSHAFGTGWAAVLTLGADGPGGDDLARLGDESALTLDDGSTAPVFDPKPLADILSIAGPARFAAIVAQADAEIDAGVAALGHALAAGRPDEVVTHAHALVGMAGAVGCVALSSLARRIQYAPVAAKIWAAAKTGRLAEIWAEARTALAAATMPLEAGEMLRAGNIKVAK